LSNPSTVDPGASSFIKATAKSTANAASKSRKTLAKSAPTTAKSTAKSTAESTAPKPVRKKRTTTATAAHIPQEPSVPAAQALETPADEIRPASVANKRARAPTQRLADATTQAVEAQATRIAAKNNQQRRAEARMQQAEAATTVEQAGDSEEVRRLKGEQSTTTEVVD
jgi:hypothetical protein